VTRYKMAVSPTSALMRWQLWLVGNAKINITSHIFGTICGLIDAGSYGNGFTIVRNTSNNIVVFCVMTTCSLVHSYQCYEGSYSTHSQGRWRQSVILKHREYVVVTYEIKIYASNKFEHEKLETYALLLGQVL
jgi:hypothetical protein